MIGHPQRRLDVRFQRGFGNTGRLEIADVPELAVESGRIDQCAGVLCAAPVGHRQSHHRATPIGVQQCGVPGDDAAPVLADQGEIVVAECVRAADRTDREMKIVVVLERCRRVVTDITARSGTATL